MISHPHRTIFVHVPKTGGQSVETAFLNALGLTWEQRADLLLRPNPDRTRGPRRLAHLYASEYVGLGHVAPETFAAYFKFAVTRNPWARAVSAYKFGYQNRGMPFATFLHEVLGRGRGVIEQRQIDPQTRYVCGDDGRLLVDRTLRLENLAREFAEVSRRVFGREVTLPTVNVSRDRTDYRTFYDDAGRDFIARTYRDDIETFGYQFDDGG